MMWNNKRRAPRVRGMSSDAEGSLGRILADALAIDHRGRSASQNRTAKSLRLESFEARLMLAGTPVITEFMAQNVATLVDDDNQPSDWIEITNPDPTALNLDGWFLTDDNDQLDRWAFPAVTLNPAQSIVVYASNQNRTDPGAPLHTNFRLNSDGEYLALVQPDGVAVAQAFDSDNGEFPPQVADVSYGLAPGTNELTYFLAPTPCAAKPSSTRPCRARTPATCRA